jgi:hypothetical protein
MSEGIMPTIEPNTYGDFLPEMMRLYPHGTAMGCGCEPLTLFQGDDYAPEPFYTYEYPYGLSMGFGGNLMTRAFDELLAKKKAELLSKAKTSAEKEQIEKSTEALTATIHQRYESGGILNAVGNFVGNVVKTAGHAIGTVVHSIQNAAGEVGKVIAKIPIVGGVISAVFDLTYQSTMGIVNLAVAIVIEGKRVDQAILSSLKKQLQVFKQVAPYAQMVISVIPGIGQGVSAALSAGLALAEGQSIADALKAGLIGALPGGPLIKAAVTMGIETIQHVVKGERVDIATIAQTAGGVASSALGLPIVAKNALLAGISTVGAIVKGQPLDKAITDGAIKGLPISEQVKNAMTDATAITLDLAHGKPLDRTLLSRIDMVSSRLPASNPLADTIKTGITATKKLTSGQKVEDVMFTALQSGIGDSLVSMGAAKLPPDAQKAIKSGVALGTGAVAQVKSAEQLTRNVVGKLTESGIEQAKANPMFGEARKLTVSKGGSRGFDYALGMVQHLGSVFATATCRNNLPNPNDKMGFDMACAAMVGAVCNPRPGDMSATAHAGQAITLGMQGYSPERKQAIMATIGNMPSAVVGATSAIKQVASRRESPTQRVSSIISGLATAAKVRR